MLLSPPIWHVTYFSLKLWKLSNQCKIIKNAIIKTCLHYSQMQQLVHRISYLFHSFMSHPPFRLLWSRLLWRHPSISQVDNWIYPDSTTKAFLIHGSPLEYPQYSNTNYQTLLECPSIFLTPVLSVEQNLQVVSASLGSNLYFPPLSFPSNGFISQLLTSPIHRHLIQYHV